MQEHIALQKHIAKFKNNNDCENKQIKDIDNTIFNKLDTYDNIEKKFGQISQKTNKIVQNEAKRILETRRRENLRKLTTQNIPITTNQTFSQSSDSDNNDINEEVNSQNNNFNQNKQNYLMVLIENLCEKTQNFNQIQLRKICDIYKIDFKKLQELETREKKEDYIFDCMQNAIDSDVLKLNQIIDQHEHEYKNFLEKVKKSKKMQDPDLQADIDIRNVQNSDMEWMNIKTNHYPIQFYLKQILLQELEKDQNRKNVEKFEKTAQNINKEKVNQFSEPVIDQNYEEIMAKIIWNKEYEQQFLQAKQETRHRTKAIGTTNQQVISAITPIVRSMNIEPNDKKYRLELCQKFKDKEQLTNEEIMYLIQSSKFLRNYIDKSYINKAISYLDKDIIDNLELQIADQKLKKNQQIVDKIKEVRHSFLKENRQEKGKIGNTIQSNNHYFQREKKLELQQRQKELKRLCQKFIGKLRWIELNKKNKENNVFINTFTRNLMKKANIQATKERENYQEPTDFQKRNYPVKIKKPLFNVKGNSESVDSIKRRFHPSSKIIMNLDELQHKDLGKNEIYNPQKDKYFNLNQLQRQYNQSQKFKLALRESDLQDQEQFKQYYSSGPQNKRKYKSLQKEYSNQAQNTQTTYENENLILNPHKNHQWITKDIENQAALKIQKGFKNFLLQKKCKACIKEIQNMKIQDVSKKVQIYVKNTQLFQNQDHSGEFQSKIIQTDKKIRKNSNKKKSTLISSKQKVSALKKQKSLTNNFIQNSNFTQNINTAQNQHSNLTSAMKQKNAYKMSRQQNGAKQIKFASVQFQSEKNLVNNSDILSTPSNSIVTNNYYNNNQFENQLNNSSQQQKDIINAYNINIQNTEPDSIKFQSNIIPQNQNKINSLNISQISHIEIPVSAFKSNQNSSTKLNNNKSISSKQNQSQKLNPYLKNNQSDNEWYMKKNSSISAITTQATSQNISSVNSLQRKQSVDQKLDHLKQKYSVKDKEEKQKILNQYWKKRQKNFDQAEENQNILKVKHQKLFKAAMQSNYQLLLELVQQGYDYEKRTDVCRKDLKGNTALHYVVSKNNIDFVMWLLEKSADVNIQNKNGNTPLHIAFRNRDVEIISRLIEYGGNLNIQNNLHLTPVAYGGMDTFQQLGLENAKIRFSDQNGQLSQFDNNKLVKIFENFDNQIIKQKEIELLSEPLFYQHRALQHGLDDIKGEIPFIQVNVTKSFGGQDKINNEIISDKQYEYNVTEYQQKLKNQEKQRQLLERFV